MVHTYFELLRFCALFRPVFFLRCLWKYYFPFNNQIVARKSRQRNALAASLCRDGLPKSTDRRLVVWVVLCFSSGVVTVPLSSSPYRQTSGCGQPTRAFRGINGCLPAGAGPLAFIPRSLAGCPDAPAVFLAGDELRGTVTSSSARYFSNNQKINCGLGI